jgi:hypothetical protein
MFFSKWHAKNDPEVDERTAVNVGLLAFAQAEALADCPYGDPALAAAWQRGYRRAELMDGAAW